MGVFRRELDRIECMVLQHNRRLSAIEKRQTRNEQAILELSTALREARAELEELRALSPFASTFRAASRSADTDRRLHA